MPIYEYRCRGCNADFEKYVPGAATKVACPTCASNDIMRKLSVFGLRSDGGVVALLRGGAGVPLPPPRGLDRPPPRRARPGLSRLMDLRRLEIFVRVAEFGSFSRAAEALFLTQPTVSEPVRALEDELGVQLLDRLGRGAAPTPAGQLLLGYARRLLTLASEAHQAIDQFQGRLSGELMVGGSSIPGEYVLPALIGAFRAKHPEIAVSLQIGDSRIVQEWVEAGRVEIGVVGVRPTARALESRQIMADELVVVVAPDHPWAGRAAITVEDI